MHPTISIAARIYSPETLVHRHPFAQVVLPDRGRLDLVIAGQRGAVAGRGYAVVQPDTDHVCWADSAEVDTRCLVVDLPASLFEASRPDPALPSFHSLDARSGALVHLLQVESTMGGLADRLVTETLGRYAVRIFAASAVQPAAWPSGSPGARLLARRIREYLDAHSSEDLTLGTIADAAGASVAHAQRSFRAEFGQTIVAYVHDRRLAAAVDLLRTTDHTVADIALKTGFGSGSYLARLFTRRYSMSPSRMRSAGWSPSDAPPSGS